MSWHTFLPNVELNLFTTAVNTIHMAKVFSGKIMNYYLLAFDIFDISGITFMLPMAKNMMEIIIIKYIIISSSNFFVLHLKC